MQQKLSTEILKNRKTTHPIEPLILNRWSSRSMTGESIPDEEFLPLFEAARWAPSSYNGQPWVFLYAKRETPEWDLFFNLLDDGNKKWTKNAALLLVIISHKIFDNNNKPSITHSYDTGAAWMSLALEGTARGFVVHGMQGFDYDKARRDLEVPDDYQVEAMAAIGRKAPKEQLPEDLQKREVPSSRKPLEEIIMNGKFRKGTIKKTKAA